MNYEMKKNVHYVLEVNTWHYLIIQTIYYLGGQLNFNLNFQCQDIKQLNALSPETQHRPKIWRGEQW